jgi:hypothetical protein
MTWKVKAPPVPRVALTVRKASQDDDYDESGEWGGVSFD